MEIKVKEKEESLNSRCPTHIMNQIHMFMKQSDESNFETVKTTQVGKFKHLFTIKSSQINLESIPKLKNRNQSLTNLSSHALTEDEKNAVSMGLNFAIPKKNFHHDVMYTVFNLKQRLYRIENQNEMKNNVRIQVANLIDSHSWKQKLDRNQLIIYRTLRNLRQNSQLHICKADKGNQTVILNKDDYHNKVMKMLEAFP